MMNYSYLSCAIKHKTINFYRYWNAQKAASTCTKRTALVHEDVIAKELITKEEIRTLERSNNNIIKYYFQSSKQGIRHCFSIIGNKCFQWLEKCYSAGKSLILKNKAFMAAITQLSSSVSRSVGRLTDKVSVIYHDTLYKYSLRSIQKKQIKAMLDGEKEVMNKGNMSSVIGESKLFGVCFIHSFGNAPSVEITGYSS